MRKSIKKRKLESPTTELSNINNKIDPVDVEDAIEELFEPEFDDPITKKKAFIDPPNSRKLFKDGRSSVKRKGRRKANNHPK